MLSPPELFVFFPLVKDAKQKKIGNNRENLHKKSMIKQLKIKNNSHRASWGDDCV